MVENETGAIEPKKNEINADSSESNIGSTMHISENNFPELPIQNNEEYKYKGQKIGTANAKNIFILSVKAGFLRIGIWNDQAYSRIESFHTKNGGVKGCAKKAFKNCVSEFAKDNLIEIRKNEKGEKDNRGQIKVCESPFWEMEENINGDIGDFGNAGGVFVPKFDPLNSYGPEEEKSGVYLVYFESYIKIDSSNEKNLWRCKIGITEDLEKRYANAKTFFPEKLIVHSFFKHPDQKSLESYFHSVLTLWNRKLGPNTVYGSEWFFTNPEEILKLYNYVCNS